MNELKRSNVVLENQMCFPLYVCAKEVVRQYTPHLERLGLTYTQYITMLVLWQYKAVNAKQIGKILYLDSGTLTPVLKRLEEKGWITRSRSREDERNLWVSLTPAGEAMQAQAEGIPALVSEKISLPPEDAKVLHRLLHNLMDRIE